MVSDDSSATETSRESHPETGSRAWSDVVLERVGWHADSGSHMMEPTVPWGMVTGAIIIAGLASANGISNGIAILLGCTVALGFGLTGRFIEQFS